MTTKDALAVTILGVAGAGFLAFLFAVLGWQVVLTVAGGLAIFAAIMWALEHLTGGVL